MEPKIFDANISDLIPTEKNPRELTKEGFEQLKYKMETYPKFITAREVVIDENMRILGGHQRVRVAKEKGDTTIRVKQVFGWSDEEKDNFIIADNVSDGTWDWDKAANFWDPEELKQWGVDVPDWSKPDEIIEDEVPEPPEEPKSKLGDVYQLGQHRLMCGDSTKLADVEKLMDGATADCWLTDPPYNVDYTGKTKDSLKIKNDKMDNQNFRNFLVEAYTAANNVLKAGGVFYIWHADSEGYNFRGACADVGWKVRQCLVWNKNTLVMGRQDYQWKHEPCLYGWKEGTHHWFSDRCQTTVIDYNKPSVSTEHPTMKPIGLFAYLIENSTEKGQVVLDSFCGSGTTLIACEQLGRKCYAMEFDPHYCDVIIERWEKLTGLKASKI